MKKYIIIAISAATLMSCADKKKQEKQLLDSVIAVHDKVMGIDAHLMKNKMMLDSLLKDNSANINKDSVQTYLKLVDDADNAMSDWMHKFDAENKNKSHEEIMNYLGDQKKQITQIDAQINTVVTSSSNYLNNTIKK